MRGIDTNAISRARGVGNENNIGAVVQGTAGTARGHDLDTGIGAIGDAAAAAALGKLEPRQAKGAVARHVEKLGRQRNVEIGHIVAQSEIDKDVGPGVVQLEGHGAAGEGPLRAISCSVGNVGAFGEESALVTVVLGIENDGIAVGSTHKGSRIGSKGRPRQLVCRHATRDIRCQSER